MQKDGRSISRVDGNNMGEVLAALSEPDLTGRPALVVVDNPSKLDLKLIEAHQARGNSSARMVLHYEGKTRGNTKFGKLVNKTLKGQHKEFLEPKPWDAGDLAIKFCIAEAKERGKSMSGTLAGGLVSIIGTDLGMLAFEILKAVRLAEFLGDDKLTIEHIKAVKAPLNEAEMSPIIKALELRKVVPLIRALDRLRSSRTKDPTIWVCHAVQSTALRWLAITDLMQKDVAPKDAAAQLDMNPWFFKNKVLPHARRWGRKRNIRLVKALAASERGVLSGHQDPWTGLCSRLIEACQEHSS